MIKDKYYSDRDDNDARWMVQNYIVSKVKQLLNIGKIKDQLKIH